MPACTQRLAALGLALLAGCSMPPAALTIQGPLQLPASAPAAAEAVVELRDTTDDHVLTEQRQLLREAGDTLPFGLQVPRGRLIPGHTFSVRGALLAQGWAQWLSEPVAVDVQRSSIDLGTLVLTPARRPLAFATHIDCGGRLFSVGMAGDLLTLRDGDRSVALQAVPTAAGERLEAVGDASTFVHTRGRAATVGAGGVVYTGCSLLR